MARKTLGNKSKAVTQTAVDCTALYVRVSTELQANEGYSLEAQTERLHAYCVSQGWNVCTEHVYIDAGLSGKSTDRPAFQAMLEAAKSGNIKRIVAMKLDRIARNVREFLATVDTLKDYGCDLVLVKDSFDTSTPQGRFALTMFAALAEMEAYVITERVMTGKATKATKGGYNGSATPLGYDYTDGRFTLNMEQAQIVNSIFEMYLAGSNLSQIAQYLNDTGATTKQGGKWYAATVKYIIANGAYAGLAQWDGVEAVEGTYPSIIDLATYEAAQIRLNRYKDNAA